ncbi:MAG: phage tail protein [Myxococcales bacterium]|nr:phage tail protein [Myxococcales bacterium]
MATLELPRLQVESVALITSAARLLLINRDPAPNDEGVPIDSLLSLELVDAGPDGIDRASTRIWVDGVLAFDGNLTPAFAGPLGSAIQTTDTLRIVLHPGQFLASLATVAVHVVTRTLGGAHALDETYRFTVEDRTAPRLVSAQAVAQKQVRLVFDEPVALPSTATVQLTPVGAPAVPLVVVATQVDGNAVLVALDTEMTPDVEHEVQARGVTDLAGNPVLSPFDRVRFTGFRAPRPQSRRFELWQMLPKHNRREDTTGDLFRFIACLQELTDLLLADVDRWPDIFDLERGPESFLELILQDLGNPFPFELDVLGKRRLAAVLVEMYRQKGTVQGIKNAVRFFLGIDIIAITAFNADTLVLGESLLGVDWVLGPSDRFAKYAFNVVVARILAATERKQLRAIVEYLKPAHTHFVDLVEPFPPVIPDHWELGLSDLGETTDLH